MKALALTQSQKQDFTRFQADLTDGCLEGIPEKDVNDRLGGLGVERVRDVAEERAYSNKCGNVICTKSVSRDEVMRFAGSSAITFLSTGAPVRCSERVQYCSEACYLFFKEQVIQKRPEVDVWSLQQAMVDRGRAATRAKQDAISESTSRSSSMVGAIKERKSGGRASKSFVVAPDPEAVALRREMELLEKKKAKDAKSFIVAPDPQAVASQKELEPAEKKKAKDVKPKPRVTFSDHVTEVQIEANPPKNGPQHPSMEDDDSSSDDYEEDEEDEGLLSFLDPTNKKDIQIENAGLSAFATVWSMLKGLTSEETRRMLRGADFSEWEPDSITELAVCQERRMYLKERLMEGARVCNLVGSPEFIERANQEFNVLITTFDYRRPLPPFQLTHWALLAFVLLSALEEAGRFTGFDMLGVNALSSLPSTEISALKPDQFDFLIRVLRPD